MGDSNCTEFGDIFNTTFDTLPATLVSSCLSIVGSTLTIIPFLLWKDVRQSSTRKFLFFLAISDFFTAVFFSSAAISRGLLTENDSIHYKDESQSYLNLTGEYYDFCTAQAVLSVYFQCVSFFLTSALAIYFFVVLICNRPRISRKLMIATITISWCVPMITTGCLFGAKKFGLGDSRSSVGWCFINDEIVKKAKTLEEHNELVLEYFGFELIAEKLWEILTIFVIIISYLSILIVNRCKYRKKYVKVGEKSPLIVVEDDRGQWNTNHMYKANGSGTTKGERKLVNALSKADIKLILVPLIFLLFRFWGTLRFFISMNESCHLFYHPQANDSFSLNEQYFDEKNMHVIKVPYFCISQSCFNVLYNKILLFLHAFGDPAQGFGNAILFVFLSKPIFMRLFGPFIKMLNKICCCLFYYCKSKKKTENKHLQIAKSMTPYFVVAYTK